MNRANSHRVFKRLFLVFALAGLAVVFVLMVGVKPMQAEGEIIDIVVNPPTLTADGGSAAITVTVTRGGSALFSVPLTVTLSPTTLGSVNPFTPTTDSNGQAFSTWTAGTFAGSGQLIVEGPGFSSATSITLTAGAPHMITLQVNPTSLIAKSPLTSTIVARALDAHDNPVPGVPLGHSISPVTMGSVTGLGTTGLDGRASGTWTAGTVIGNGTLSVGNGNITNTSPIALTAGPPDNITLTAAPDSLVVGGSSALTAVVTDHYGNSVANGTVVTFTSSLGTPSPPTRTTTNGVAGSSLPSTRAGTAYITATSGTAHDYATVTFSPGPPSSLTLDAQPPSQMVGNNSSLTATVHDQYSNPVGSGLLVTFTKDLGSIVRYGTTSDGIATSSISSTLVGTAHVTATCQGVPGSTVVTFTPGGAYTLTLQANPTSLVVGHNSALTATVTDRYRNFVADGTDVAFDSPDLGYVPSPVATSHGVATSIISSRQSGVATITASSGSGHDTRTVTFNPDVPDWLTLEASPTTQVVGSSSVLTARVYDLFDNPVEDNWSVTFAVDRPGTILTPITTTDGVATSRVTVTLASVAHITATSGAAEDSTTINFTPGGVTTVTVLVNPPNLIAKSPATAAITATAIDRYRNSVPNVTLRGNTAPSTLGTVSGLGATNANGQSFGTWRAGSTVGSGLLRVGNGSITGTAAIALLLTSPQTVTVQVISSTLFANSGMSTTVTAILSDTYGNPVPNATVNFGLSPSALGSEMLPVTTDGNGRASNTWTAGSFIGSGQLIADAGGGVSSTAAITLTVDAPYTLTLQAGSTFPVAGIGSVLTATVTDRFLNPVVNGTVVTFTSDFGAVLSPVTTTNGVASSWISWTLLGMVHITATSGSAQDSMAVNFVPNVPATVTFQATPTSLAVGNSSMLTATVVDQFGHYVADGTAVTITTDLGYVLSPVTTTDGIATSVISSTQAGVAHITATSGWAQGFATVTFLSEVPATMDLQADPTSLVVGNSSVLTATVRDRYNNLVASGFLVTFTTDLGDVISPGTTADGVATSSVFARLVGTAHITAMCESIPGATVVSFLPDVPYDLTLQADPTSQIVGNSSVLTATVRDGYGNLVADSTVVSLTSSLGSVTSPVTTTNGIATSSVSSTLPGIANIVATSGVAQGTASATFVPDASATTTRVQLGTDTLIVNSNTTTTITATFFDFYGNLVPGVNVTGGYLSPTTLGQLTWGGPTNLNGQAFGIWKAGTVVGSGMLVVGNSSITVTLAPRRVLLPLVMRDFPPTPVAKSLRINGGAEFTYQITVTLEVSATLVSDYVEQMRFSNDSVHWSDWLTFAPTTTWKLASNNGLAVVYAQFKGHRGGISAVTSDDILLFKNGDFSQPNLVDWIQDPNSRLIVSTSTDSVRPGNPAGLLGSPAYGCHSLPVGYASLSQSFIVPTVPAGKGLVLEFSYHIFTYDRNIRLDDMGDRFDVLFNNIRVLRDMNQSLQYQCSTVYDLGRKVVSVSVVGNPGDNINVIFRLWNSDEGFNTYVYLDDVHLRFR